MGVLITISEICSGNGVMGDEHCKCNQEFKGKVCETRIFCSDHGHYVQVPVQSADPDCREPTYTEACKCDPGWKGDFCGYKPHPGRLDAPILVLCMLLYTRALISEKNCFAEFRIAGTVVVHGRHLRKTQ